MKIEEIIEVLARHSTVAAAEAELGLRRKVITDRFRRRGLHASDYLAKHALPEGMEIKALHTRLDREGEVVGQTVLAQRESKDPPKYQPIPDGHHIKGMSTYVGPEGDVRAQWVKTDQDRAQREAAFVDACEKATERYRGIASPIAAPKRCDEELHVIIPLGDPHVGMLSWAPETGTNFDTKIAERELFGAIEDLVSRSPSAESCTLLNLGDYFHAQNDKQLTPSSGHKLDVDSRSAKITELGLNLFRRAVDCCLSKFKIVRAHAVPGNHDPDLARLMMFFLKAVYEKEDRVVVVPNFNPFAYWVHGKNLFGTTHGNGVKLRDLPGVMAADVPELWGQTTHRYIHSGHVHHDSVTEVQGTLVYTWRTLAPNDSWAHGHGYRSGKSLCALAYTREGGEVSRVSVDLGCVQRRIAAKAA